MGLEHDLAQALCVDRPCLQTVTTDLVLLPSGREERRGTLPPLLCHTCPERQNPHPRIRHVEIVRDCRGLHGGEDAARRATLPSVGHDEEPEAHDTRGMTETPTESDPEPDDGFPIPPAWGPEHPDRLIAEGREPEPPRRRRSDGTTRIGPEDFGVT